MQEQIKRSADGEGARSQTPEAQEHRQSPPTSSGASSNSSPKGDREAEDSTSATQNDIHPDEAQRVVGAYLRKSEDNAAKYLEQIEEMLSDWETYNWAESTLISIYDFIEEHGYITTKQMEAIDNIRNSHTYGNRHSKSRRSRR